jgi:hypothetical protein
MSGRWRVRKSAGGTWWWAESPELATAEAFPTHAEAIAFADSAARSGTTLLTVEA